MNMRLSPPQFWFAAGCATELGLLAVAAFLAQILGLPFWSAMEWRVADCVAGVLSAVPALGLFWWSLKSRTRALAGIRDSLEGVVKTVFCRWSVWQIGVISLLAGVCEEMFFRACVQGALANWLGPWGALVAASVLFGLAHPVTRAYVVLAALMGAYLGGLWLLTGNLLVPVVAHTVYDWVALMWLRRTHRRGANLDRTGNGPDSD